MTHPARKGDAGPAEGSGAEGGPAGESGAGAAGAPPPPRPDAPDPTLMYVIKQVELAVRAQLDEIFRPIGMTALQYTALTVLERHPDLSSAQLARNSFVTAQTMADMVTALEGRGLIERHRDAADRRRLVLALTGDGRDLLRRYRDRVAALEERMLAGLTAEQAGALRHGLAVCRANLTRPPAALSRRPRLPGAPHRRARLPAIRRSSARAAGSCAPRSGPAG